MLLSRSRHAVHTILRFVGDLVRLVVGAVRSRAQLSAENLFLKKQLALYVERPVKPRRADDATRIALVALSRLIDWRRILTIVQPATLIRWHRKGCRLFALEVATARATARPGRRATPDHGHGLGESHVGRRADRRRVAGKARYSRVSADGEALPADQPYAERGHAVATVEHLRAESRQCRLGQRFPHRDHGDVSCVLRVLSPWRSALDASGTGT